MNVPNLRTMTVSTSSGKDVKDTSQLKGEAKDSLSGKNDTGKEYTTGSSSHGKLGGMPSRQ
jgi:hypothetical protein